MLAVSVFFLYCLLKPIFQGLVALMVVGLACCAVLSLHPPCACEQLCRLWRPFPPGVFAGSRFQVVFFQAVTYSFLDILQRCLQYQYKSISNFLRVFLLVEFLYSVSLASLLRYSVNIKSNLYRYIVCGYYLYIFCPIELQPVYKYFLYKYQINYALLGPFFLGRFASQGSQGEASCFQFVKQVSRLYFYYNLLSSLYYIVRIKVPQDY